MTCCIIGHDLNGQMCHVPSTSTEKWEQTASVHIASAPYSGQYFNNNIRHNTRTLIYRLKIHTEIVRNVCMFMYESKTTGK